MQDKKLECQCGATRKYRGQTKNARKYSRKFGWKYTKFTGDKCPECIRLDFEERKGMIGYVG